jgi:hypothetical protein
MLARINEDRAERLGYLVRSDTGQVLIAELKAQLDWLKGCLQGADSLEQMYRLQGACRALSSLIDELTYDHTSAE